MATLNSIPPIPIRSPLIDDRGMISIAWLAFIREIYNRVGGASSTSNATLAANLASISDRVTTLESEIGSLGVGRAL